VILTCASTQLGYTVTFTMDVLEITGQKTNYKYREYKNYTQSRKSKQRKPQQNKTALV